MSEFPYAKVISQQHRRNVAAFHVIARQQPRIAPDELPQSSSIVVATSALHAILLQLHQDPRGLRTMDRRKFEELVAELFDAFGYSVELTSQTRDGGRDVIAIGRKDNVRTKFLIECKRPDPGNPVGVGVVRQLLGVLDDERATKGIVVTTTYFSSDARAFEERNEWRLELKQFDEITSWIAQYVHLKRG